MSVEVLRSLEAVIAYALRNKLQFRKHEETGEWCWCDPPSDEGKQDQKPKETGEKRK